MKNRLIAATVFAAAAFLASCTTSRQTYQSHKATLPPVPADAGRLFVYRDAVLSPAKPAVLLDDAPIGTAAALSYFYVDRAPGTYTVSIVEETSTPLTTTLTAGNTTYVRINLRSALPKSLYYATLVDAATADRELAYCKPAPTPLR